MTIIKKHSHAFICMAILHTCLINDAYGGNQFKDPIISLSLSIIGKQRLIKESLNGAKVTLEKFVNDAILPEQKVGPPEVECNKENIRKYGHLEVWSICPGIPDYFFRDGNRIPNLRPRPIYFQLGKTHFKNVEFDEIKVPCEGASCDIIIPLKSLEIESEVEIRSLNKSRDFQADELILRLKPITLRLDDAIGKRRPFIKLRGTLQANKSNSIFKFDETSSLMYFPHGVLKVDLAPHLTRRSLGQILNGSGKLSINKHIFSTLLGVTGVLNEDLSELYKLIDLDKRINDHFNDPAKIGHVNKLVNSKLLPTLLRLINDGIENADIFGGSKYTIPGHRLQDLLDQSKWFSFVESVITFLRDVESQMEISVGDIAEYSYQGLSLEQVFSGLEQSRNIQLAEKLEIVLKKSKSLKKSEKYANLAEQIREQLSLLEDHSRRLIKQIKENESDYQQDIELLLDLDNFNDGGMKLRLSEVLDFPNEQPEVNRKDWDLAGFVGFNTLNRILEKSHHEQRLNFCLNSHPALVCSQVDTEQHETLHVSSEQAPQVIWDAEKSLHYLSLMLRVGSSDVRYRIYLKPGIDRQLRIVFFNRVEIDNAPEDEQLEQIIINHILGFIRSLHPLLENLVPETIEVGEIREQEGAYPLEVPWLEFHEVGVLSSGFVIGGKVKV